MNCRRVVNLMSAYADGELTGIEMLEIRRHLNECKECNEEYETTRLIKQAVSRLSTVKPRKDFAASILTRLDAIEVPRYQKMLNSAAKFVHQKLSPVAAALAVSGVALVILSAGGIDGVHPESAQDLAMSQYEASPFGVDYSREVVGSYPLDARNEPLVVRDDVSELTRPHMEFASLSLQ